VLLALLDLLFRTHSPPRHRVTEKSTMKIDPTPTFVCL
jgi:hypothetical protein